MERRGLLLADDYLDASEPLPRYHGYRTCQHDMAEAGELAHASMVRAGMRLWNTFFFFFPLLKYLCRRA